MTYRVGRKLGRTVYRGDELIGMMDTAEDAARVVHALNAVDSIRQAYDTYNASGPHYEMCDEFAADNELIGVVESWVVPPLWFAQLEKLK